MKRLSIRARLSWAFLLVGLVSVAVAGLLIDRAVRKMVFDQSAERLRYEVTMMGQMVASALFAPLAADDTSLQGPVTDLAKAVRTHLGVLTAAGAVVADSEQHSPEQSEAQAPEIVAALKNGRGSAIRSLAGTPRLWVAERVVRDGHVLGIARASMPMTVVDGQVRIIRQRVLMAALAALLLGSMMAIGLSLGISRPIRRLAEAARRIGGGDLDACPSEPAGDEIGELSKAFRDMSLNLKDMIAKLDVRNAEMRLVLDSIDQGLAVVSLRGEIEAERSARIDTWFDAPKPGTPLAELFVGAPAACLAAFHIGFIQLLEGLLPLCLLLEQLPKRIVLSGRIFDLNYAPILRDQICERLLVVVSDTTLVAAAELNEAEQRDLLGVFGHTLSDRAGVLQFLSESDSLVAAVRPNANAIELKRAVHTLKGNCAINGVLNIASLCHEVETRIAEDGALDAGSAELLASRWSAFRKRIDPFLGPRRGVMLDESELAEVITSLIGGAPRRPLIQRMASWTMMSVDAPLSALAERAKSLAERLGKGKVGVHVEHDGTRLNGDRWAPFWSSLVHAVRNAVDHGLETPEERAAARKSESLISLSARHVGGAFVVEVADDGRGIDWQELARKLAQTGLPAANRDELVAGLCVDGVSTAERISVISGRGVGMGALRQAVERLGGTLGVSSTPGEGTIISCRFPAVQAELAERVASFASMVPNRLEAPKPDLPADAEITSARP